MIPNILLNKSITFENKTNPLHEQMNGNMGVAVLSFAVATSLFLIFCWIRLIRIFLNEDDVIYSTSSTDQPSHSIHHDPERTDENALDTLSFGNNDQSRPSLQPWHRRNSI